MEADVDVDKLEDLEVDNLEALFRDWTIDTDERHGPTYTPPTSPGRKENIEQWAAELMRQLRAVDVNDANNTIIHHLQAFESVTMDNHPTQERIKKLTKANQILYKTIINLKGHYDKARNVAANLQNAVQTEAAARREAESRCETLQYHLSLALREQAPVGPNQNQF